MERRFLIALAFCGMPAMLAGCVAGVERDLQYADSLERSAERLREHGPVQNAVALEQQAQRQRKEALSFPGPMNLGFLQRFFDEPAVEDGFEPIRGKAPASPDFE